MLNALFPHLSTTFPASEEAIERRADRFMDAADYLLIDGKVSQREYDYFQRELRSWTDSAYRQLRRAG